MLRLRAPKTLCCCWELFNNHSTQLSLVLFFSFVPFAMSLPNDWFKKKSNIIVIGAGCKLRHDFFRVRNLKGHSSKRLSM